MAKKDDQKIHQLLKDVFGFDQFKGNQEEIIKSILGGSNTFVLMPTGGGKSLCYQLPALMSKGTAIVVSPLIALMKNQVDMIRNFGTELGIAHVMNSSLSKAELLEVKEDLKSGKTKLLYPRLFLICSYKKNGAHILKQVQYDRLRFFELELVFIFQLSTYVHCH